MYVSPQIRLAKNWGVDTKNNYYKNQDLCPMQFLLLAHKGVISEVIFISDHLRKLQP
jgi:hypothetical protein